MCVATNHYFSCYCGLAISIISLDFFSHTLGWHFTTTKGTFPSAFLRFSCYISQDFFSFFTRAVRAVEPICIRSLKSPLLCTRDAYFQQQRRETSAKAGTDKACFSESVVFSCLLLFARGGKSFLLGLAVWFITLSALVAVF